MVAQILDDKLIQECADMCSLREQDMAAHSPWAKQLDRKSGLGRICQCVVQSISWVLSAERLKPPCDSDRLDLQTNNDELRNPIGPLRLTFSMLRRYSLRIGGYWLLSLLSLNSLGQVCLYGACARCHLQSLSVFVAPSFDVDTTVFCMEAQCYGVYGCLGFVVLFILFYSQHQSKVLIESSSSHWLTNHPAVTAWDFTCGN